MKLSILICSLNRRRHYLDRLMAVLCPQEIEGQAEVLCLTDDGQERVGDKRNKLIAAATGDYVCFVDDDDLVSSDYVSRIIAAAETSPDCIGMQGIITTNGRDPKPFIHSLQYKEWFEKDGVYYRYPNHLNPIKRSLALQVPFKAINFGEDKDFSDRILPLLTSEIHIEEPIYFYEFRTSKES